MYKNVFSCLLASNFYTFYLPTFKTNKSFNLCICISPTCQAVHKAFDGKCKRTDAVPPFRSTLNLKHIKLKHLKAQHPVPCVDQSICRIVDEHSCICGTWMNMAEASPSCYACSRAKGILYQGASLFSFCQAGVIHYALLCLTRFTGSSFRIHLFTAFVSSMSTSIAYI